MIAPDSEDSKTTQQLEITVAVSIIEILAFAPAKSQRRNRSP
jgi:hypothetical protein